MKFSCDKYELQNACSTASRAVASKSPVQTVEGLLLKAESNRLSITGYDLKKAIITSVEAETEENGSIVVNTKLFNEIIRRMPEGTVSITSDVNDTLKVKCGKSEFKINGMNAQDYPELPKVEELKGIELKQAMLKKMINRTIFAVADNELRPIYTGELFNIENGKLTLVAIDGYRLAKRTEAIEGDIENVSFIVPANSLSDVEKICEDADEKTVKISVGTKHISFTMGDTLLISRRLEGDFLDYKKSIPTSFKYTVSVDKAEFTATIDRVGLVITDKNTSPVRVSFRDGSINCVCTTAMGYAEDTCLCEGNGEGMEIGFNNKYLMDALKAAEVNRLNICINTPNYPCVISPAEGENDFTYMILPMRLKVGN